MWQLYDCGETTDQTLAKNNPIRYRGYYYDQDTGLYYLNARYYSPELRRFIQPAKASSINYTKTSGLNLFAYANNNPVGVIVAPKGVESSVSATRNSSFVWPDLNYLGVGFDRIETGFTVFSGIANGVRQMYGLPFSAELSDISGLLMGVDIGLDAALSMYNNLLDPNLSDVQKLSNIVGDIIFICSSNVSSLIVGGLTKRLIPCAGPVLSIFVEFAWEQLFDQVWHGENVLGVERWIVKINNMSIDECIKEWLFEYFRSKL